MFVGSVLMALAANADHYGLVVIVVAVVNSHRANARLRGGAYEQKWVAASVPVLAAPVGVQPSAYY